MDTFGGTNCVCNREDPLYLRIDHAPRKNKTHKSEDLLDRLRVQIKLFHMPLMATMFSKCLMRHSFSAKKFLILTLHSKTDWYLTVFTTSENIRFSLYDSQRPHPFTILDVNMNLCIMFVQTTVKCQVHKNIFSKATIQFRENVMWSSKAKKNPKSVIRVFLLQINV